MSSVGSGACPRIQVPELALLLFNALLLNVLVIGVLLFDDTRRVGPPVAMRLLLAARSSEVAHSWMACISAYKEEESFIIRIRKYIKHRKRLKIFREMATTCENWFLFSKAQRKRGSADCALKPGLHPWVCATCSAQRKCFRVALNVGCEIETH